MGKQSWKAGNMLNPVPAVMVSVADQNHRPNIITVAWAGTVCTNPPMPQHFRFLSRLCFCGWQFQGKYLHLRR